MQRLFDILAWIRLLLGERSSTLKVKALLLIQKAASQFKSMADTNTLLIRQAHLLPTSSLAEHFQQSTEGHYPLFTGGKLRIYSLAAQVSVAWNLAQMGPIYGNTWPCQDQASRCSQTCSDAVSYTRHWYQAHYHTCKHLLLPWWSVPAAHLGHPKPVGPGWWPTYLSCRWRLAGARGFLTCAAETGSWLSKVELSKCLLFPHLLRKQES